MHKEIVSEDEIRNAIKKIIERNQKIVNEKGMNAMSALMGDAMKELRGKAAGNVIANILKEELEKVVPKS